jgi:hypothetical protein
VPEHATVVRVGAATGAVGAVVPVGPEPFLFVVVSDWVWTLNLGDGTLSLIDPSSQLRRPGQSVGDCSAVDGGCLCRCERLDSICW